MKFSLYDLMSKLVPGGVFLLCMLVFVIPEYLKGGEISSYIDVVAKFDGLFTALGLLGAYFVGYVLEALGSLVVEPILWKVWGGWPIKLLYQGKVTSRTTFPQRIKVFEKIIAECFQSDKFESTDLEFDELYYFSSGVLRTKGSDEQVKRQQSYIESYLFARNIFTSIILFLLLALYLLYVNWRAYAIFYIVIILFALLLYIRLKDKSLYQTRHLLNSVYHSLK